MIILISINWTNLLPWHQSRMIVWRVNKSRMIYQYDHIGMITSIWSHWYDHINMITSIWSHRYDHISMYKLIESVALTSVFNDCLGSQQGHGHISKWSHHIDMITKIWSFHIDMIVSVLMVYSLWRSHHINMIRSVWMAYYLWRSNGKWHNLSLVYSYIPQWYE